MSLVTAHPDLNKDPNKKWKNSSAGIKYLKEFAYTKYLYLTCPSTNKDWVRKESQPRSSTTDQDQQDPGYRRRDRRGSKGGDGRGGGRFGQGRGRGGRHNYYGPGDKNQGKGDQGDKEGKQLEVI